MHHHNNIFVPFARSFLGRFYLDRSDRTSFVVGPLYTTKLAIVLELQYLFRFYEYGSVSLDVHVILKV